MSDLQATDDRGVPKVRGLSFQVRAGEIVGIAGVDGNGQTELIDCITGLRHPESGTITVAGQQLAAHVSPGRPSTPGWGTSPRTATGAASSSTSPWRRTSSSTTSSKSRTRSTAGCFRRASSGGRASSCSSSTCAAAARRRGRRRSRAGTSRRSCSRARSTATRACSSPRSRHAASTSGRSSSSTGGSIEERDEGRAILLVSLELEEILSLSDRILVVYEGEIVGEYPADGQRGDAGHRDDGRPGRGGRGVSETPETPPPPTTGQEPFRSSRLGLAARLHALAPRRRHRRPAADHALRVLHGRSRRRSRSAHRTRSRCTGRSSTARA